ncbi:GNAT family N-acetyltransferase [Candidatus Sumerlaeota bacterium]|nr:GNAT family N-acetyltransferase [Candidatus Sumerlaeota bacterium]
MTDASTSLSLDSLQMQPLASVRQLLSYPANCDLLTMEKQSNENYLLCFATSQRCIERAQRLRYLVFNEELGEGLEESRISGLDRDEFDATMHHLVLLNRASGELIGTYRVHPAAHALKHGHLYSARQYDVEALAPYLPDLVEAGRACIAPVHRNFATVMMLWKGLAVYMSIFNKRWLFGCVSITSTDPDEGWRMLKTIRAEGAMHPELALSPYPQFSCGDASREHDPDIRAVPLTKLFSAYIGVGAQVISLPAIDREFKSVDFLMMLDKQIVSFSALLKHT